MRNVLEVLNSADLIIPASTQGGEKRDGGKRRGEFIYLTVGTISYHDPHNQGESSATGCQIKTELSHQEVLGSRLSGISV